MAVSAVFCCENEVFSIVKYINVHLIIFVLEVASGDKMSRRRYLKDEEIELVLEEICGIPDNCDSEDDLELDENEEYNSENLRHVLEDSPDPDETVEPIASVPSQSQSMSAQRMSDSIDLLERDQDSEPEESSECETEESNESEVDDDEPWNKKMWVSRPDPEVFDEILIAPNYLLSNRCRPVAHLDKFFDDEVYQVIVTQTNLYAEQKRIPNWTPVDKKEIRAFLGIIVIMGYHILPQIELYWSTDPGFRVEEVASVMPIKRFKNILRALHLNDNTRHWNLTSVANYAAQKQMTRGARILMPVKGLNVSQCVSGRGKNDNYVEKHILNSLLLHEDLPDSHWHEYKKVYKKQYKSSCREREARKAWRANLRRVAEHNRLFLAGKHSFALHLNLLGDLGQEDYFKNILKLIDTVPLFDPFEDRHRSAFRARAHLRVPSKVDWRTRGFRPKREEQLQCGACYAFSVTHALQAQVYRKHGDWRELSPQQIVDCSGVDGNMGCDGGSLRAALRYVTREGLTNELHYPYAGKRGKCHRMVLAPRIRPRRWAMLPSGDEAAMERALATIGPLAVAVNAAPFTFQLYRSGIYDDPFCTPWELNHAMLLVGYTSEYWILLNWWGRKWGEDGYIRIRRGFNRCGVANMAAYVEL